MQRAVCGHGGAGFIAQLATQVQLTSRLDKRGGVEASVIVRADNVAGLHLAEPRIPGDGMGETEIEASGFPQRHLFQVFDVVKVVLGPSRALPGHIAHRGK